MRVNTGLYAGSVRHTRVKPRHLSLHHRCFWLALDLDRIADAGRISPILSHNRFNILSFHDDDFGCSDGRSLRRQIEDTLARAGYAAPPVRIVVFAMPRVLGYGFNPLTLFFCLDRDDDAFAIIYEVHNTFKQRHCYVAPVRQAGAHTLQQADKAFYVSPFLDMELTYTFKVTTSPERMLLSISARDAQGPVIFTSLNARWRELDAVSLLRAWLGHPLLSFKVIGAIHFHAARLWTKRIGLRVRPPPPDIPTTLGKAGTSGQ